MTNETTASQPKVAASDENHMDAMRELVSEFRKAAFEFGQGGNPDDHSLMMRLQQKLFVELRAVGSQPKSIGDERYEKGYGGRAPAAQASATIQAAPNMSKLDRYEEYGNESGGGLQEAPDGDFVRLSDVEALIAATIKEPVMVAEPVGETQTITINGRQLQDALDAAWPDREDVEQGDTELTMFVRHEDGVDSEGNAQPRGLWFYWTEYPEEGVSWLNHESEMPPLAQFADSTTRAAPMVADPAGVAVNVLKWQHRTNQPYARRVMNYLADSNRQLRLMQDEIDDLRAALTATVKAVPSEALDASPWTRTEDRLPPVETPVFIVHSDDVKIGEIRWENPSHEETFEAFMYWDDPNDDGQSWDWLEVTHWMPIPAAPLADKTGGGE